MRGAKQWLRLGALVAVLAACQDDPAAGPPAELLPEMYRVPVVVHVIHRGEPVGEGSNFSAAAIAEQIRILNDDFRRRPDSRGFNSHPDGADARIEFVLATVAPGGEATSGIVRINRDSVANPTDPASLFDYFAFYSYWDHTRYLNVWTMPLGEASRDLILGFATGPDTDLPGAHLLLKGEPHQAEGILINAEHFGETAIPSPFNLGRTLTHEAGHYLGLLHLWGGGDCEQNDYCADTPAVANPVSGCGSGATTGCDGRPAMAENYMSFSADACMNLFTREQVARMRHVLETSRRALRESGAAQAGQIVAR